MEIISKTDGTKTTMEIVGYTDSPTVRRRTFKAYRRDHKSCI